MKKFIVQIIFLISTSSAWAKIEITESCFTRSNSVSMKVLISGEITDIDADTLQMKIGSRINKARENRLKYNNLPEPSLESPIKCDDRKLFINLILNSKGGNLDAAIRIGELIREFGTSAIVHSGNSCQSACVFILAASPRRFIEIGGIIGIHRPYYQAALNASNLEMNAAYKALRDRIKNYLDISGVNTELADAMMRIPPERVKILTRKELEYFGLNEDNIEIQEADAMLEAQEYGISRQELIHRRQQVSRVCGLSPCEDPSKLHACLQWTFCKRQTMKAGN